MAKHTPPDDNSFTASLVRHLGAAAALVAVVALAFWGIGQVRDDGSSMTVASSPDASGTDDADPSPTVTATAEPDAAADDGMATELATHTEEATEEATATEPADPEPTPTATEDEVAGDSGDIDPADISVQVLDATGGDGPSAAEIADRLRSDGFNVVAENKAVRRYEVTTVFYTPGKEAEAEQLAAMYGYSEVAPEPGNLSHDVDVHLVVGLDA